MPQRLPGVWEKGPEVIGFEESQEIEGYERISGKPSLDIRVCLGLEKET